MINLECSDIKLPSDAWCNSPGSEPLVTKQVSHCAAVLTTLFTWIFNAPSPAVAEERPKPSIEKWRPKDGRYTSPGLDFDGRCMESDYIYIDLAQRSIGGNEWSCEVNQLTDTARDTIRLSMKCYDLNLAESLRRPDNNPEDRTFKEVMVLKRTNENAVSIRKTLNGKFGDPAWQADYCPQEAQQAHAEAEARGRAASEYKIPEQLSRPNQWRPKDGIYASTGPDFGDRCAKSGDVAIGLIDGSISSGKAQCKVVEVMNTGQAAMSLNMTCNQPSAKQPPSPAKKGSETNSRREAGTLSMDVIRMSRIDDNTFHMQKTVDRKFKDDGGPVAYCPEDAQRAYAARKVNK